MNVVVVKTEADIEQQEQEPPNCEIKHEIPIHIKDESGDSHNVSTITDEMGYYDVESCTPPNATEHTQNFIIYELESPTTTNHQTPPTILNTKLRKRPKIASHESSTVAAEQKKRKISNGFHKVPELKVKCICRLGTIGTADATKQPADANELKRFYEEAFDKTRQLTLEQQRSVKMTLLDAICEAEQDVDEGKCCANCTMWAND